MFESVVMREVSEEGVGKETCDVRLWLLGVMIGARVTTTLFRVVRPRIEPAVGLQETSEMNERKSQGHTSACFHVRP